MKLIYLKSVLKCDSFDVIIGIKIPFLRVLVTIEPSRSLLQFVTTNCLIHWKQIIGTPNSKICKPLTAEDDYELTTDLSLQVLYMSHNWYRLVFWSQCVPYYWSCQPIETFKLVYLMKEFLYQKMDDIHFDCRRKKNSISLSSKVDFFAVGQLSNLTT